MAQCEVDMDKRVVKTQAHHQTHARRTARDHALREDHRHRAVPRRRRKPHHLLHLLRRQVCPRRRAVPRRHGEGRGTLSRAPGGEQSAQDSHQQLSQPADLHLQRFRAKGTASSSIARRRRTPTCIRHVSTTWCVSWKITCRIAATRSSRNTPRRSRQRSCATGSSACSVRDAAAQGMSLRETKKVVFAAFDDLLNSTLFFHSALIG